MDNKMALIASQYPGRHSNMASDTGICPYRTDRSPLALASKEDRGALESQDDKVTCQIGRKDVRCSLLQ